MLTLTSVISVNQQGVRTNYGLILDLKYLFFDNMCKSFIGILKENVLPRACEKFQSCFNCQELLSLYDYVDFCLVVRVSFYALTAYLHEEEGMGTRRETKNF